jgi:hypothetical protein
VAGASELREVNSVEKVDLKGKGTMELCDGVLLLRWRQGANVGIDVAKAAIETISTLGGGHRLPILVEVHGVTHSAAARSVFPDPSSVSRMALLVASPADHVVARLRLPVSPPGFPIRYFTSEDTALAWLRKSSEETEA